MNKIINSVAVAIMLVVLVVVMIVISFPFRTEWWSFADIFFVFMMAFTHLMALTLRKMSERASRILDRIAIVCGMLFVIAFIVEFILFQCI